MKLFRKIRKAYYRGFTRNKFCLAKRQNHQWLLNYSNHIDRKLLVDGQYEQELITAFSDIALKLQAQIFIDVGANIGLYSVMVGGLPSIQKTYSIEAMKANSHQLSANLLLNNLHEKTTIIDKLVSNEEKEIIFLENKGNSTGRSRVKDTSQPNIDATRFIERKIRAYPLDALIDEKQKTIMIKMDVEDHEREVLAGMKNILAQNRCYLQVEVYPHAAERVDELMRTAGYALLGVKNETRYYSNIAELCKTA